MAHDPDHEQVQQAISRVLAVAQQPGNYHDLARLGVVSPWLQRAAAAAGIEIGGFEHVVDTSAVRHIRKNHSDAEKERLRGQLPVTDADFLQLPEIIASPDKVVFGTANRLGHDQIAYVKTISDGATLYLEEVRSGRWRVAAQALRKYPPTMNIANIVATLNPNVRSDREAELKIVEGPAHIKNAASQHDGAGADLRGPLMEVARRWMPRILTQICRDPSSPLYGCADRNWWHYKIRDFSSIILQQAGYALHQAADLPLGRNPGELRNLAAASARFWNHRALKHYAFEEYYPWEQGYPPLAFSSLAVAKLAHAGAAPVDEVAPGLRVAARQLRTRLEDKAGNQQVAGLAALAWIDKVLPAQADAAALARQKARTLALQHEEGWYWEYDGPDLGYLAVTIDCLWDLYDATGDEDFRNSIRRALAFTARFPAAAPGGVGLHNSRNTDYLVPYGIVRSALQGEAQERRDAALIAAWAFAGAADPDHYFAAVDDRYICHYIGHSVLRALHLLGEASIEPAEASASQGLIGGSGHYLSDGLIVSCRKGGIVTLRDGEHEVSDFGWILTRGKTQFVTHWWSDVWQFREEEGGALAIDGPFFPHKERLSTPLKHMVLRVLSFVFGRRLTALLKRVLIFKRSTAGPSFARRIERQPDGLLVTDLVRALKPGDDLRRAPRASKRHVASADSFHPQDLSEETGFTREEERAETPDGLRIVTRYRRAPAHAGSTQP